jgi:hypothetical protein
MIEKLSSRQGVANLNRSLGRIWENFQKKWLFGHKNTQIFFLLTTPDQDINFFNKIFNNFCVGQIDFRIPSKFLNSYC